MSGCLHLKVSLRNLPVTRTICSKSSKNSLAGKEAEARSTSLALRRSRWGWYFQRCSVSKGVKQRSQGWRVSTPPSSALSTSKPKLCLRRATGLAYFKGELVIAPSQDSFRALGDVHRRIIIGAQAAAGSK